MITDSLTPAAPPADAMEEETLMLNGLVEKDLTLAVDVPQITLRDRDLLVRDPDGNDGAWRVTGQHRDDDVHLVVAYTTLDGAVGEFTFPDPDEWVRVDVGQVSR
jgi:hypothetical protein